MKDLTIGAKAPKINKEASIIVKAPENLEEAVKMFSPEAILSNAMANWVVTLQGNIRGGLTRGEDAKALQARLGAAKMGVAATKAAVDPKQAWLAQYAAATPEERKKMKAELLKEAEAVG